jgi:hypothetical protein
VLTFSTSAGRHGTGHRASETLRQRLSLALDDHAAPTWLWWLAMSAVWCAALVAVAGMSTPLGSPLLTEVLGILTFGLVIGRTVLRIAGRIRRHADRQAHPSTFLRGWAAYRTSTGETVSGRHDRTGQRR